VNVLILAAGRGERLRPLTDTLPKPLLPVAGIPLIERLIMSLARYDFTDIVVNYAYLGDQIEAKLGTGEQFGVDLKYSKEPIQALETGGGIFNALPLLCSDPFLVLNSDIWTDFPFATLPVKFESLAHLVLVDNPQHNLDGDFVLDAENKVSTKDQDPKSGSILTFSGIGVYNHELFANCKPGRYPLAPIIVDAAQQGLVSGQHYQGRWIDVGTPERLIEAERAIVESAY